MAVRPERGFTMKNGSFSRRAILGGTLAAPFLLTPRGARAMEPVDVELVLAVDVSRSVDEQEQALQFRGYANAFRDPKLIDPFLNPEKIPRFTGLSA